MGFFVSLLVSFAFMVIGELLRPKTKTDKLKPSGLSDFQFPTSDPSRTIGVFWGTCKFKGPNVPWFGDLTTKKKTKKVKTGWFSSTKVDLGIEYSLGIMMSIAWGGESVVLVDITVGEDEKCLLDGADATDMGDYYSINFNAPDILEGTEDFPNGIKGPAKFYKGTRTQTANLYLQSKFPEIETCGFRGLMYLVLEHCYVGNSDTPPPFIVTARRCPNPLGLTGGAENINGDANFANMCYEVLTETAYWGLSTDPAKIDIASFIDCGMTLAAEGLGGSMTQEDSVTGKSLLAEMLRHVDGVIYSDPATGKWTMRLARGGYSIPSLPVFDNSNIVPGSFEFSRVSYAETRNVVSINYTDRAANFQTLPVEYKDKANIFARGGVVDFESIDFLALSNSAAAGVVASRVGKTKSSPLGRCEFRVKRIGSTLRPADVLVLNKPDYNITGLVMRVVKLDYGSMDSPEITVVCTEDIFAVNTMAFLPAAEEGSGWESPVASSGAPVALAFSKVVEAPFAMVESESRHLIALGVRDDEITEGFQVWSASGTADVYLHTGTAYGTLASGVLVADFDLGDTTFDVEDVIDPQQLVSAPLDVFEAGHSVLMIDDEFIGWMTVTDNLDGTFTVSDIEPAIFDTVRRKHLAGARVYFLNVSVPLVNSVPYAEDQWVLTRLPTFAHNVVMSVTDVPYILTETNSRSERPNPPGKVRINGLRDYELGAVSGNFTLSWAHRNKRTEGLVSQDDDDITPEPGTRYEVDIYNDSTDALLMALDNLAESPVSISVGTTATLRVELFSVDADGQRSLYPQEMVFAYTSTGGNASVGNDGGPSPTTEATFRNVKAVSSTNLTLSGPQTVDTVALVAGDRVLVNGQTLAKNNGPYQVQTGAWTRTYDADQADDFFAGKQVYVTGGSAANINTVWSVSTVPVVLGTDSINFTKSGGSGGGSGSSVSFDVTQAAHGFAVGNLVYKNGASYALADADAITTAADAMVSAVADANNFTVTQIGKITGLSGLTAGEAYFLSGTAGAMTATEPTTGMSQYVGYAESATVFIVSIGEPFLSATGIGGGYLKVTSFAGLTPAVGDIVDRTDVGLCRWDGTRWMTVQEYPFQLTLPNTSSGFVTVSGNALGFMSVRRDYGMYITRVTVATRVLATNSGANYWTVVLNRLDSAVAVVAIGSFTTAADAPNVIVDHSFNVNAVLDASAFQLVAVATMTAGAPGGINAPITVHAKLIVT